MANCYWRDDAANLTTITTAATGDIAVVGSSTEFSLYHYDGVAWNLSATSAKLAGIETGATADQTASEILTAIKTVDGALSGLDADTVDGLEPASFPVSIPQQTALDLKADLVGGVSMAGLSSVYVSSVNDYTITDYDSFATYSVVVDSGSVSRVDEVITVTAPATAGTVVLTISKDGTDTVNNITILAEGVETPTNVSPPDGSTDRGESEELTGSAFTWAGLSDTHASSDWQIATDVGFTNIIDSSTADAVNLTTWTPTGIVVSQTYYWRVRYTGASNGTSEWSVPTTYTTRANFDPIVGVASVFNSAYTNYTSVTSLDATKAIVTYRDAAGNLDYGTACVLSVSGTTITAGTPVVFESSYTHYTSVTSLDATKAIVTYRDDGSAGYGTANTISGLGL